MLGQARQFLFGPGGTKPKASDTNVHNEARGGARSARRSKDKKTKQPQQVPSRDQEPRFQVPPTPKVKKQHLRASIEANNQLSSYQADWSAEADFDRKSTRASLTSEQPDSNQFPSTAPNGSGLHMETVNSSSASSGYQSAAMVAASNLARTAEDRVDSEDFASTRDDINQDYNNNLFYSMTSSQGNPATQRTRESCAPANCGASNPPARLGGGDPTDEERRRRREQRLIQLELSQKSALMMARRGGRELEQEEQEEEDFVDLATMGEERAHIAHGQQARALYKKLQQQQQQQQQHQLQHRQIDTLSSRATPSKSAPIFPVTIDYEEEENLYVDEQGEHLDEATGQLFGAESDLLFAHYNRAHQLMLHQAGQATHCGQLAAMTVADDDDRRPEDAHYERARMIDGESQHQLSWRHRQALSLGREVQHYHLRQNRPPLDSCDDERHSQAPTEGNLGRLEQSSYNTGGHHYLDELGLESDASIGAPAGQQSSRRSYADTKRMLITASKLNNQQQLYRHKPFDYAHFQSQAYFAAPTAEEQQQHHQRVAYLRAKHISNQLAAQLQRDSNRAEALPNSLTFLKRPNTKSTSLEEAHILRALGAMQASASKYQLAPSQEDQRAVSPNLSPFHQQQIKRSKSGQQLHQHKGPNSNTNKLSNFQLQANRSIITNQVTAQPRQQRQHTNKSANRMAGQEESTGGSFVLSCCGKMAKFFLSLTNALFWLAGIGLGAWGILTLVDDHKYNLSQLLVFEQGSRMSLFQLLSWSFITLGCATILVGFCGCSATFKNNRWILGLYIFLILTIFALDLATGLLAMIFQERLVANVRLRLVNKLKNEYGIQASFTAAIDYIQTRFECCGLEGHLDYDQSLWRLQRLGGFEATVARTCCHLRNTFDDQAHVNPRPVNESMCQSTDVRFHQSYRYRRGCLDDLERLIRAKIWTFTIGCGAVGAVILLSLMFATCFCRAIPSNGSRKDPSQSRKKQLQSTEQQIASLSYLVDGPGNSKIGTQIGPMAGKKQGHAIAQYK